MTCGDTFELHPHYQLAYRTDPGCQWVFCQQLPSGRCPVPPPAGVGLCLWGTHPPPPRDGAQRHRAVSGLRRLQCALVADLLCGDPSPWHFFAQEYLVRTPAGIRRHFKTATPEDRLRYDEAARTFGALETAEGAFAPARADPGAGRADQRPLLYGFTRYRELFNARQLLHLTRLGRAITALADPQAQHLLSLAFSEHLTTNCMYTAYAFGYRRH